MDLDDNCPRDPNLGLEDADVHDDPPHLREEALRMAVNVVAYAMTH